MPTTTINKTIYLVESKVEFAATMGSFPANIESIECSDDAAVVEPTNVQQIKLYKYYTDSVGVDTITVKITLVTTVVYEYMYNVTVEDSRIDVPDAQLMLLNSSYSIFSPRTSTYTFKVPLTVIGVNIISSEFIPSSTNIPVPYMPPVVVLPPPIPGESKKIEITQSIGEEGRNIIILEYLFASIPSRRYPFQIRSLYVGDCSINGYTAAPFLIDLNAFDLGEQKKICANYIHTLFLNPSTSVRYNIKKSTIQEIIGGTTKSSLLSSNYYYNNTIDEIQDFLVDRMSNFPLVQITKDNANYTIFELIQNSDNNYRMILTNSITIDNSSIQNDVPANRLFGFTSDFYESTEDTISGNQTIRSDLPPLQVCPPMISLDCTVCTNQHEGVIRQNESVRLYNFLLNDSTTNYKNYSSYITFPERTLPPSSFAVQQLVFKFTYNRQNEVFNSPINELPVVFVEPYYITLKLEFREPSGNVAKSFITLYGTESTKTIVLDRPLNGLASIEVMEARIPKCPESLVQDETRRALLGYVIEV